MRIDVDAMGGDLMARAKLDAIFQFYIRHKGWQYEIRPGHTIGMKIYKVNKRKSARRSL